MTDATNQPGPNDKWAHIIANLIVTSNAGYIVYIGKTNLHWETTPEYDQKFRADEKFELTKHNSVFSNATVLQAAAARKEFSSEAREELLCMNGNALTCTFELDYVGAENALNYARQFLRERSDEISRSWYMSASFAMALGFMVTGLIIWIQRARLQDILGMTIIWLIVAAAAGAMGALLSVILRSGRLNVDPSSGRLLHYLEGASRIWAGSLSAIVVAVASKAGLVLGALGGANKEYLLLLAAIAAGASERLATSIISRIDPAKEKTNLPASS